MSTGTRKKTYASPGESVSFRASSPGRLLHDAHLRMSAGLMRTLRSEGHKLTTEGWGVLSLLCESDELSQFEISERVGKDRHHTSRLIDALEQQGLVVRKPDAHDRRVKLVALTDKGRVTRRKLLRTVSAFVDGVFEGVSERDFDTFIRVLAHITERLASPDPGAPPKSRSRRAGSAQREEGMTGRA